MSRCTSPLAYTAVAANAIPAPVAPRVLAPPAVLSVGRFLSVVSVRFLPLGGFLPIMPIGPVRLRERVGKLRRQRVRLLAAMPRHGQLCALLHKRRLVLVQ